jgi:hypothetical protein
VSLADELAAVVRAIVREEVAAALRGTLTGPCHDDQRGSESEGRTESGSVGGSGSLTTAEAAVISSTRRRRRRAQR